MLSNANQEYQVYQYQWKLSKRDVNKYAIQKLFSILPRDTKCTDKKYQMYW